MKLEKGDVVYNEETDELGYVCAVFKTRGYESSYNIVTLEEVGRIDIRLSVYNFDNKFTLISKGDFK